MPGPLTIAGNAAAIESGFDISVRRGVGGGREQVRTWRGTDAAITPQLEALLADPSVIQIDVRRAPDSAVATLAARFGKLDGETEEIGEETLTIQFNDTPTPINIHPEFSAISSERIKLIDEAAKDGDLGSLTLTGQEVYYYELLLRGVDSYRASMPVVTHTITASRSFGEALAVELTGLIFTTGEVADYVGSPVLFSIPTNVVGVTQPDFVSSDAANDVISGWRLTTQLEYVASGKVQLISTFEYGIWQALLYDEYEP